MASRVTLQIEPNDPRERHVALQDLLDAAENFLLGLRKENESVSGSPTVIWRVVALSHSSPAVIGVEPELLVLPDQQPPADQREEIVEGFLLKAESLNINRVAPLDMDREYLNAFRRLAEPVRKERLRITIGNGAHSVEVTGEVEPLIEAVLEPKTHTLGSATGVLEFMDIHGSRRVFRIYPAAGPRRITCYFPPEKLEEAKNAIGVNVRVFGELTYLERDSFPDSIQVDEIEILERRGESIPTLYDIRGMLRDDPRKPSAAELVRAIRDE